MVGIVLKDLKVKFDDFVALHNINIDMEEGKITTLLGPSGCGKTTTLRSIAGFNDVVEGDVMFDDKVITHDSPQSRESAFVFQNYALWPHMSVFNNIAYGLSIKKIDKDIIKQDVKKIAQLVGIEDQLDKKPSDLSGGQQQRVALARALVVSPQVLLCDEPLSNLDAKLRVEMRIQVRKIVNKLGLTCIWVTHDQEEALSLSDHIIVMDKGKIMQSGDPIEVYTNPDNLFVGEFMGEHSKLTVRVIDAKTKTLETKYGQQFILPLNDELSKDEVLTLLIRPEHLTLDTKDDMIVFDGILIAQAYMGKSTRLQLKIEDGTILHFDKRGKPTAGDAQGKAKAGIFADRILAFSGSKRVR